jgi:hypothetical protein
MISSVIALRTLEMVHPEKQALIVRARTEDASVQLEYACLRQYYPHYKFKSQSLIHCDQRSYDNVDFVTAGGSPRSMYFDISPFFGGY